LLEECKQEPGSPERARCPGELAKFWFRNEDWTQIKKMHVHDDTVLVVYFHHHPNMLLLGSRPYYKKGIRERKGKKQGREEGWIGKISLASIEPTGQWGSPPESVKCYF
jgi:hypothetical protein